MSECRLEIGGHCVVVRRTDKVLFPQSGLTKGDLLDHYLRCAPRMLPHLRGRPLVLQRFPNGIGGEGWFQQRAGRQFPDWIPRARVPGNRGIVEHVVCNDAATLAYLVDQATITLHVWASRADRPRQPDRVIFDLDPPDGAGLAAVRFAARAVRALLDEVGLYCALKTTGKRGYHVVTPIRRGPDVETVHAFARRCAEVLAARHPHRLTAELRKPARGGRVFVDWLRNGYGQASVAPWSVRAVPGAPVATPIAWEELSRVAPGRFTVRNLPARMARTPDPWRGLGSRARALGPAQTRLARLGH